MTQSDEQKKWEIAARRIARRVNLGWCFESMAGPLLLVGLVAVCAILLVRRENPTMPAWPIAAITFCVMTLVVLLASFFARRKFETIDQAFVRIEAAMHLRSALSAARAGVCIWPTCPDQVHAGLQWNWLRALYAPISILLLLVTALIIPISQMILPGSVPDQPQAWLATEGELDQLEKEKVVDQEYIEQVRKKIEELRAQDPDAWFSHASTEASDNMRKEHLAEAKKLERDLSRAAKALGSLEKSPKMNDKERARLANELEQALDGLKNGTMKPNPGLLNQLKELDPQQLQKQLTPEQMQQLKENMQNLADQLDNATNGGQQEGEDWSEELNADGTHPNDKKGQGECDGEGEGEGDGEGKDGSGKGGITRGPGHDTNLLGKASDEIETGKLEGLQAQDLSKSLPGDLLELQDGEHDVDQSASQLSSGGATGATGRGGDRVWRDTLDPEEQKALKKFFE